MNFDPVITHDPAVTTSERESAVIAGVVQRPAGAHVLVTRRADYLDNHPGQMSFPGGGRESHDRDLLDTAQREAREEIGLHPYETEIIGRLDDIKTVTAYSIRPYVATIPDRSYRPMDGEVAEIAVLPVDELTDPTNYEQESFDHPDSTRVKLHYFEVDGYTIWGATARMLAQLLELTTDWEVPTGEVERKSIEKLA